MSRYDWSEGSFVLPTKAVLPLRRTIKAEYDAHRAEVIRLTEDLWTRFTAAKARYAAANRRPRQVVVYAEVLDPFLDHHRDSAYRSGLDLGTVTLLHDLLSAHRDRPTRVTKAEVNALLPVLPASWRQVSSGELTVAIHGRTLHWHVSENNHAVEQTHASRVGRAVVKALDAIEWTRGSGGYAVGNDEYCRESRDHGGGGNYTTMSYGPLGKKVTGACDAERARRPRAVRGGYGYAGHW